MVKISEPVQVSNNHQNRPITSLRTVASKVCVGLWSLIYSKYDISGAYKYFIGITKLGDMEGVKGLLLTGNQDKI